MKSGAEAPLLSLTLTDDDVSSRICSQGGSCDPDPRRRVHIPLPGARRLGLNSQRPGKKKAPALLRAEAFPSEQFALA
jgi:hypothetical protein